MAMGEVKIIAVVAVVVLGVIAGWQIVLCELANVELESDLPGIASQAGARIGLETMSTAEELRSAVIHKAGEHNIQLQPEQVTVQRTGSGKESVIHLEADYKARVNVVGFSFTLRFTPSSTK
jgi:hypothetical protein